MGARQEIPSELGGSFIVGDAIAAGVRPGRLRGRDLDKPFHGIRVVPEADPASTDPWEARRAHILRLASAYAPRLGEDRFFSHETAAAIWGAPLFERGEVLLHVSTVGTGPVARGRGVRGHRTKRQCTSTWIVRGLRVASFATLWASMGTSLARDQLVVLGDYGCRVWRDGYNRPHSGRRPITTPEELLAAMRAGRRVGIDRLRDAHPMVRLDAWSPRETRARLLLIDAGLPDPRLNVDVYDAHGGFIACVDLAYPEFKVAIEYQGQLHGEQYARDIERIERLRADGWIVIQVTSHNLRYPNVVARRTYEPLRSRGWRRQP
jgi:hypothetical protein